MLGQEARQRIIQARERGVTVAELSRCYGVSEQSIYKLLARYRTTGDVSARTYTRGRKSTLGEKEMQQIDEVLQKTPDITLKELREKLQLPIQVSRLSQIVRQKLGYTYKKRWSTPANKTDQMYNLSGNAGRKKLRK